MTRRRANDPPSRGHQRARARGLRAETLCAWWLRLHGYRILGRNLRTPVGEVDILARRGRTLAVIEVKRRESLDRAAFSLEPGQRRRLMRAAGYVLATVPRAQGLTVRFDAMLVAPWRFPIHIADAWRPDAT
jgi:putative endonuclease